MHISSTIRESAVIQICRNYRADWPGARLRVGDFAEAWRSTGLREADLALALREMLDAGVFTGRPQSLESELELSAIGAELICKSRGGLEGLVEGLMVRRTLERARRRVGAPGSGAGQPVPARRGTDRRQAG